MAKKMCLPTLYSFSDSSLSRFLIFEGGNNMAKINMAGIRQIRPIIYSVNFDALSPKLIVCFLSSKAKTEPPLMIKRIRIEDKVEK